ncbi:MAG: hypothetical protein MI922_02015 [Bacteroidales bacterium]|nr:hypothetical protein [Bacteroidales bacterium]
MRYFLTLAIVLGSVLISCTKDPDYNDLVKESEIISRPGTLNISIKGISSEVSSVQEELELKLSGRNTGTYFEFENDSVANIYFMLQDSIYATNYCALDITKIWHNYYPREFVLYANVKNNNEVIEIGTTIYNMGEESLSIDSFDANTGYIVGNAKTTFLEYVSPYGMVEFEATIDFDLKLNKQLSIQ